MSELKEEEKFGTERTARARASLHNTIFEHHASQRPPIFLEQPYALASLGSPDSAPFAASATASLQDQILLLPETRRARVDMSSSGGGRARRARRFERRPSLARSVRREGREARRWGCEYPPHRRASPGETNICHCIQSLKNFQRTCIANIHRSRTCSNRVDRICKACHSRPGRHRHG